jgi:hypothetical protein
MSSRELHVVRLAEFNLTTDLEITHQDFTVDHIFVHEGYNPPALYNDIALVRYVRDWTVMFSITFCVCMVDVGKLLG